MEPSSDDLITETGMLLEKTSIQLSQWLLNDTLDEQMHDQSHFEKHGLYVLANALTNNKGNQAHILKLEFEENEVPSWKPETGRV